MGWDAFAEPVDRLWSWKDGKDGLADAEQDAAFAEACERVITAAGAVDAFLRQGCLDCSNCAVQLAAATGRDVYPDGDREYPPWDWTPDEVKDILMSATWNPPVNPEELWAFHSAKEFLETCATLGLGVRFSW